jgi:hypothetical protein
MIYPVHGQSCFAEEMLDRFAARVDL